MRNWLLILALSLPLGSATATRALAQGSPADKAAAESLFDRGLVLLKEGKTSEACSVLEQSQAIEGGIGTMLYLADCYERLGRTASAWALFREAASQAEAAGQNERANAGRQRADRLTPLLATLTIDAPALPSDAALSVTRAGTAVPTALLGVKVPVDPGDVTVEAHAIGYAPFSTQVHVVPQGAVRFALPALVKLPEQPVAAAPLAPQAVQPAPINARRQRRIRFASYGVGAAGVASALLGGAFGIRAIVKSNAADGQCQDGACSSERALVGADRAHDAANTASRASNAFWISSAVLGVSAVSLYFAAPSLSRERRTARARPLSIALMPRGPGAELRLGGAF